MEWNNRWIVKMARTLKYWNPDLEFPPHIWAELVTTAVYLFTRFDTSYSVDVLLRTLENTTVED